MAYRLGGGRSIRLSYEGRAPSLPTLCGRTPMGARLGWPWLRGSRGAAEAVE